MFLCSFSGPGRPHAFLVLAMVLVTAVQSEPDAIHVSPIYPDGEQSLDDIPILPPPTETKTVFGFLDFITTVGNTVMVFTSKGGPGNTPVLEPSQVLSQLSMEPTAALQLESLFLSLEKDQNPSPHHPFIEIHGNQKGPANTESIRPSAVQNLNGRFTDLESGVIEDNHASDSPIYDLLSTEPGITIEETYRVESTNDITSPTITSTAVLIPTKTDLEKKKESSNTVKGRLKLSQRKSAASSYKERLKARLANEKQKLSLVSPVSQRRSFSPSEQSFDSVSTDVEIETKPQSFRARVPRTRFRSSSRYTEEDLFSDHQEEEDVIEKSGRTTSGFGSRSSRRPTRQRPNFRPRNKNKIRDAIRESTGHSKPIANSRPTLKPRKSFGSRGRFNARGSSERTQSINPSSVQSTVQPSPTKKKSFTQKSNTPKIEFKKFDRFKRPNLRKNLLNKFFSNRPGLKNRKEEVDENKERENEVDFPDDHDSSPSALVPSILDDEDILQNLDNEEIRLDRLQTTLLVSTVYPEESSEEYLEVATIRSPYTFNIEDNQKSTRFITVTRTFSKTSDIKPSKSLTSSVSLVLPTSSIRPDSTFPSKSSSISTPLFDTKSIPPPENILTSTSTPYSEIIEGSANLETLPPLILASSLHYATPPLKIVTETFNTEDVMIKKSVLPIVDGTDTSFYTLSQTYSVTKFVTAVKTIPPMELYEFSPENSFADFDNLFEEAGSENRESLLPGELEFSDQDNFGLEGPNEIRVAPPDGFLDDLDLIGDKHEFINQMEQNNNPELFDLKKQNSPVIESSFGDIDQKLHQQNGQLENIQATPSLNLGGLGITPEQLLYLQLLQNPLAALGIGGGLQSQVITESSPIYKTEPIIQTSVIKLFLGAKEFFTTLASTVGLTTKTDYVYSTKTVSGGLNGLGGLAGLGGLRGLPLGNQQQVVNKPQQPQLGGILPSITVVSSPVTRNTVITETLTEEYKIRFRNQPTLTTVTSTKLVTTQVVSFVTRTQQVFPSANPLAGLLG